LRSKGFFEGVVGLVRDEAHDRAGVERDPEAGHVGRARQCQERLEREGVGDQHPVEPRAFADLPVSEHGFCGGGEVGRAVEVHPQPHVAVPPPALDVLFGRNGEGVARQLLQVAARDERSEVQTSLVDGQDRHGSDEAARAAQLRRRRGTEEVAARAVGAEEGWQLLGDVRSDT
jgi:hypothetical protein